MVGRRRNGADDGGHARGVSLTLGLGLLVVGAYLLSTSMTAGPLAGVVAGAIASLLGIELLTFALRGRRFP